MATCLQHVGRCRRCCSLNALDLRLIDDRQRDLEADAIDGQQHQRQQIFVRSSGICR